MAPGSISYDTESEAIVSGSITASGQTVEFAGPNTGTEALQITGTWVGTIVVEASNDGTTWDLLNPLRVSDSLFVVSITANGLYLIPSNGYVSTRIRASAWTSGTATIKNKGSDAVSVAHVQASLNSGQLVPTITNKLRMPLNTTNITVGAAYTSLFSYSGKGLFFGFQAAFNSSNVRIKLTIDSGIVFEYTLSQFLNFQFNDTTTTRTQMGGFITTIGNTLDFSTRYAIPYTSNVDISVQRSDGSNHVNNNWIVFLTEDA